MTSFTSFAYDNNSNTDLLNFSQLFTLDDDFVFNTVPNIEIEPISVNEAFNKCLNSNPVSKRKAFDFIRLNNKEDNKQITQNKHTIFHCHRKKQKTEHIVFNYSKEQYLSLDRKKNRIVYQKNKEKITFAYVHLPYEVNYKDIVFLIRTFLETKRDHSIKSYHIFETEEGKRVIDIFKNKQKLRKKWQSQYTNLL